MEDEVPGSALKSGIVAAIVAFSLVSLLGILPETVISETHISGRIITDTVWDLAGSPYIIDANTTVVPGVALTIEPGVVVKVGWKFALFVDGTLNMVGLPGVPIVFTSAQASPKPADWLGIRINASGYARMTNFSVSYGQPNVLLNHASGINITNCNTSYSGPGSGICLWHASGNLIENCTAYRNTFGYFFHYSTGNEVWNSKALENTIGVYLTYSSDNLVVNTDIRGNYDGVYFDISATSNTVTSSNISRNHIGARFTTWSGENMISGSNIVHNDNGFIVISNDNQFTTNNIVCNELQAMDRGTNIWDGGYPRGGNYWSDYTGKDEFRGLNQNIPGGDGIGDVPYEIPDTGSRDNYPFIEPIGTLDPLGDPDFVAEEISFNPAGPVLAGTLVNITAKISNCENCSRRVESVLVSFFDGLNLTNEIGSGVTGPMAYNMSAVVEMSLPWLADTEGTHTICAVVDSNNSISEGNETNNMVCMNLVVMVPTIPAPPTITGAMLSGNDLADVTLEWALSPDDGGSVNVTRYDIYRGESYDSQGRTYVPWGSVPSGTTESTDVGGGEGDPDNHFYVVCAVGDMNVSSCSENQAGKFTRPLETGPNLVSVPLIQSNESVEMILQTVRYNMAWLYDASMQEWKWLMTFKDYRRGLWNVNRTMGLWVNVTGDCNLTVAGVVHDQTTMHLYEGWNLVSFPSFNASYSVSDLKAEIGATRLEGYDFTAPANFLRVLGDAEFLLTGYGYWVRAESDTDWIVEVS